MTAQSHLKTQIAIEGFAVLENIYTNTEIETVFLEISQGDTSKSTLRKTNDLFAIRQFLKELPSVADIVFTDKLKTIISEMFGDDYFVIKSIYFDKPEQSNWFVAYHQDLTISVDKKADLEGFSSWTVKQNQFSVQPPLYILEKSFTIRIHLDDTDENNGALKVIPKSHCNGVHRSEKIDRDMKTEVICRVGKGGIMIMKPLLLHASNKTINNRKRRVVHIEFSNQALPGLLDWAEFRGIKK